MFGSLAPRFPTRETGGPVRSGSRSQRTAIANKPHLSKVTESPTRTSIIQAVYKFHDTTKPGGSSGACRYDAMAIDSYRQLAALQMTA